MNTQCDNQEILLRQLSLQGDPTAFFTLTGDYFENRYLRERKSGVSHMEAQTRVVTEAVGLFEDLQHIKPAQFDAWFDEHCILLPSSTPEADSEKEDMAISEYVSACLSQCSKELVKTGSEIARTVSGRNRRFPRNILQYALAKVLLGIVAAGLLLTLVTFLLIRFEASVRVILVSPADSLSFQFPPPAAPGNDSVYFLPALPEDTVDTSVSDTGSLHKDSTVTSVATKKKPLVKPAIIQRKKPPVKIKPKPVNPSIEPRISPKPPPAAVVSPPPPPPAAPTPAALSPPEVIDAQPEPTPGVSPENESIPTIPEPVEPSAEEPDLM